MSILASKAIERNVLACVLDDSSLLDQLYVPAEAFQSNALRITYLMIDELRKAGHEEISVNTLRLFHDAREDFRQVLSEHGGAGFLDVISAKPDKPNFNLHLGELKNRHAVRTAKAKANSALAHIQEGDFESPAEVYRAIDNHLSDTEYVQNDVLRGGMDGAWLDEQTARLHAGEFKHVGHPIGNPQLKELMGQFVHGSLYLWAGETNVGKSQLVQSLIRQQCFGEEIPTLVLDNELSREEFRNRLLANAGAIPLGSIFNGHAYDPANAYYPNMKHAIRTISGSPIEWRLLLDMSPERVEATIRRFLRQHDNHPHKQVIVDGIKLNSVTDSHQEVGFFGQKLKQVAQKYATEGLIIHATCQLNRSASTRTIVKEGTPPDHNQIGLSKMLADNSDDCFLLLRHYHGDTKEMVKNRRRLICTKARNHDTLDGSNYIICDFDGSRAYLEPTGFFMNGNDTKTMAESILEPMQIDDEMF